MGERSLNELGVDGPKNREQRRRPPLGAFIAPGMPTTETTNYNPIDNFTLVKCLNQTDSF